MSTVCYCGQPDCPVTTWEHDACVANLRAERDALKTQLADTEKLHAHYVERIRELQEADAMMLLAEAAEVLRNLLVWVDWKRNRHPHPTMNEPNSGAREAARAFLAKVKP